MLGLPTTFQESGFKDLVTRRNLSIFLDFLKITRQIGLSFL